MELFIVTGSSSGIGKALVEKLVVENKQTIGISRSKSKTTSSNWYHISSDLSNIEGVGIVKKEIDLQLKKLDPKKIVLINNAGRLGEVNTFDHILDEDVQQTLFLNLSAPIMLHNYLLKYGKLNEVEVEIVEISSGAAVNSYFGWQAYCSSKAGLLMSAGVAAKEIEEKKIKAKIWSLAPGVVDTNMQTQIRSTNKETFIHVDKFVEMHENGQLVSAETVATFLTNSFGKDQFINGEFYDIRDFI